MRKKRRIIFNTTLNKSLVICTPYLKSIGGTEIEAVTYAVYFYDEGIFESISIFSPTEIDRMPFEKLIGNRKINIFSYPSFFSNAFTKIVNGMFSKLGCEYNILEYVYWKYKSVTFSTFFILTYSKSTYFFPIIESAATSKKVIGKITMGLFTVLSKKHIKFYGKFSKIIVFNYKQRDFWRTNYNFTQINTLDIMISNETNLLKIAPIANTETKGLVFGFLGRVVNEKNIMEMILLLDFLNNKNQLHCKLIIQGEGDYDYINALESKVTALNLSESVIFNNWYIDPMLTHDFFEKIDVFLVTSFWEGGPITSLEAAAAGRIILGYDIGAMRDRFGVFPLLVNSDFNELCDSAMAIINMDPQNRYNLSLEIKKNYISELSNSSKEQCLLAIIEK